MGLRDWGESRSEAAGTQARLADQPGSPTSVCLLSRSGIQLIPLISIEAYLTVVPLPPPTDFPDVHPQPPSTTCIVQTMAGSACSRLAEESVEGARESRERCQGLGVGRLGLVPVGRAVSRCHQAWVLDPLKTAYAHVAIHLYSCVSWICG